MFRLNIGERTKGILLVLLAGASWGVISLFVRHLGAAGIDAKSIAALRSFMAVLMLLVIMPFVSPGALKIRLRDAWCFAGTGIASITFFNALYFNTMQRTSVGIAVVLLYTSPIFVTMMSCFFFKEKFKISKLFALLLVTAGCFLVSGVMKEGNANLPLSVLFMGIGSGFCYALFSIFGRFAQQRGYGSDTITLWSFIFASLTSPFLLDWGVAPKVVQSPGLLLCLAGLAAISTILPYFAYTAGLKRLQPSTAAIAATIEPVVGTLVGIIIFGEVLTFSSLAGMCLILVAILL